MFATFYIPQIVLGQIAFTQPEGVTGRILCTLVTNGSLAWVGAASTVFTLLSIATERYYTVIYPHANNRKLTTRKLKVCQWFFFTS